MAYNKTTWKTGDTITAEKLNNNEDGTKVGADFAGSFYMVPFEYDSTSEKYIPSNESDTFAALSEKIESGILVMGIIENTMVPAAAVTADDTITNITFSLIRYLVVTGELFVTCVNMSSGAIANEFGTLSISAL